MNKHSLSGTKNGELGSVWMAAHFPKQIKKELVEQTNICSSVGMCLPESSNHRSKSKAVDVPVSESFSRKKSYSFVEAMRAQFSSISLPENFELDAFDLEIVEDDSSDDYVKPHLELVLQDRWESDQTRHHIFGKAHARFPDLASTSTSAMKTSRIQCSSETSVEKFRHRFILDDYLEPMVLNETDEEVDLAVVPFIAQEPECDNKDDSHIGFEDVEHPDKHPDEECTTVETVVSEMALVDNIAVKPSPNKHHTINVTPQLKATVVSGEQISDFVAIRTPASKSDARAPRKRKSAFDETIEIPRYINAGLEMPVTLYAKEEDLLLFLLGQNFVYFSVNLITVFNNLWSSARDVAFPSDLNSVLSTKELAVEEEEGEVTGETDPKTYEVEPVVVVDEASDPRETEILAPSTPVTQTTSVRYREGREMIKQNQVGMASWPETGEKERDPIQAVDFDEVQTEECPGPSSLGEDNQENVIAEKWSAVRKSVASYLHGNFVHSKERGEEEVVKLSQVLKHKTKKGSARFFYQMLVLKTGGYINVKQEKAYDEICIMQTPKLEEVFAAGSNK